MSFKQTQIFLYKNNFFSKAKLAYKNLKNDKFWVQNEVFKSCNKNKNVSKDAKSFLKLVRQWGIPLSKLEKLVTKLAQQCKWSEKSTKTWETKYSS